MGEVKLPSELSTKFSGAFLLPNSSTIISETIFWEIVTAMGGPRRITPAISPCLASKKYSPPSPPKVPQCLGKRNILENRKARVFKFTLHCLWIVKGQREYKGWTVLGGYLRASCWYFFSCLSFWFVIFMIVLKLLGLGNRSVVECLLSMWESLG